MNAFTNFGIHASKGHVWWRYAIIFSVLGFVGALAGSTLGKAMGGERLLFLFGMVMLVVDGLVLMPRTPAPEDVRPMVQNSD